MSDLRALGPKLLLMAISWLLSEFQNQMPFPPAPRVIYKTNPLEEVVCQLRFPPILRIDSELPAKFQENLRGDYPLFQQTGPAIPAVFEAGFSAGLANLQLPISLSGKVYNFISGDEKWKVALARDFLALSTNSYERWEGYRRRLEHIFSNLVREYSPGFFIRIGLRYQDVIRRSKLGRLELRWADLLKPHILGELAIPEVSADVEQASSDVLIALEGGAGHVHLKHGLAKVADPPAGITESSEQVYLIDSDFFQESRTEVENVFKVLDALHEQAGRLFRWCISDRLHELLQPSAIA